MTEGNARDGSGFTPLGILDIVQKRISRTGKSPLEVAEEVGLPAEEMAAFLADPHGQALPEDTVRHLAELKSPTEEEVISFAAVKLRTLRKAANLPLHKMAQRLGWPEPLYRDYEESFKGEHFSRGFVEAVKPTLVACGVDGAAVDSLANGAPDQGDENLDSLADSLRSALKIRGAHLPGDQADDETVARDIAEGLLQVREILGYLEPGKEIPRALKVAAHHVLREYAEFQKVRGLSPTHGSAPGDTRFLRNSPQEALDVVADTISRYLRDDELNPDEGRMGKVDDLGHALRAFGEIVEKNEKLVEKSEKLVESATGTLREVDSRLEGFGQRLADSQESTNTLLGLQRDLVKAETGRIADQSRHEVETIKKGLVDHEEKMELHIRSLESGMEAHEARVEKGIEGISHRLDSQKDKVEADSAAIREKLADSAHLLETNSSWFRWSASAALGAVAILVSVILFNIDGVEGNLETIQAKFDHRIGENNQKIEALNQRIDVGLNMVTDELRKLTATVQGQSTPPAPQSGGN